MSTPFSVSVAGDRGDDDDDDDDDDEPDELDAGGADEVVDLLPNDVAA